MLDTIRAGSIARAADLLAAHFIAGHQALVDNSWSQAKYLEVANQDEQSATSAAILLEARKHAKTSLKVETPDAWLPHTVGKGLARRRKVAGRKRKRKDQERWETKRLDDEWPESIFHHVGSQTASYPVSVQ